MPLKSLEQPSGSAMWHKPLWADARPGYDKVRGLPRLGVCVFLLFVFQGMAILPQELVDYLVECLLCDSHAFSDIAAFSLVSYGFRQVAFRKYFAALEVGSAAHWDNLCRIAGVANWCR